MKDAKLNNQTNGLVSILKLYNDMAIYVDQGGNKRPGAFAIYLEPWHADIFDFLELKRNIGISFFLIFFYISIESVVENVIDLSYCSLKYII